MLLICSPFKRLAALSLCFAAACAQAPSAPAPDPVRLDFPQMNVFPTASPGPSTRSNAQIARDFIDLAFEMENGQPLPVLTRFEGPITVRTSGPSTNVMRRDLAGLIARLRQEAAIDISLTNADDANIVIQTVPNRALKRVAPNAACFVVPRVQSWSELRAARNTGRLEWGTLTTRERAAIFIPSDVTPQEMRDCLHEELAQALGPINDLYRLPDTVFNDDNIHTVLTGFDMVILRAFYAPQLRSGMSRDQVAAALPAILRQINPRGEGGGAAPAPRTPRTWKTLIETTLTDSSSDQRRAIAALRAIDIGQSAGWTDTRAGFAQYAYGRLQIENDPSAALSAFNTANRIYSQSAETQLHTAFIAMQLAAFTLISGDADATIQITQSAIPLARRHENAALLSLLMMFQAEALDLRGNTDAGTALRLDSLGWALYGFGSRQEVVDRLNEIASLVPQTPPS
jgi:hypothetical protein